jgi:hypothetical protein
MRKFIFFMFLFTSSFACDICNMNVSLIPEDFKNTFSLMYRSRFTQGTYSSTGTIPLSTVSRHSGPGNTETIHYGKKVKEIYNVYDLRGIFYLNDKFSLMVSLPIVNNVKTIDNVKTLDIQKIGDPMVLVNYNLVNTKLIPGLKTNHRLNLGVGVKLPFGSYRITADGKLIEPDLQPGTGSLDFLFTTDYVFTKRNFGVLNNMNFKLNTANKSTYRYRDSWNHTLIFFYLKEVIKNVSIMPNTGFYYEYANVDSKNSTAIPQSGGAVTFANFGFNIYFKKMRFEATYQEVIYNNMMGNTQLPTKKRTTLGLSYYIN